MATSDKKRTLLTETPVPFANKELLTDAIRDAKNQRAKALENAHNALVDAFGPKLNSAIVAKLSEEGEVTELDIDQLIKELEDAPEDDDMIKECKRRLDEARDPNVPTNEKEKMYRDIHRKFWAYVQSLPQREVPSGPAPSDTDNAVKKFLTTGNCGLDWISHEGSMIVSALIAVAEGESACVSLNQLPEGDRVIVNSIVYKLIGTKYEAKFFWVHLDEYKNFVFHADIEGFNKKEIDFTVGNRVSSIPPSEASRFGNVDVKVEKKGRDILIGDRIKLEKSRIQNLVQAPDTATHNSAVRGGFVPRQKVAGRNAYEIRADVLEMALDWAKHNGDKKMDSDDVLDIAEAFYSFVEHK